MTRQFSKLLQIRSNSLAIVSIILMLGTVSRAQDEAVLPHGVRAVWDLSKAYREATPTRERISINGLWKWQPADEIDGRVPTGNWGYFKVPGCWPGITDYMQKDCQTVFAHPSWQGRRMGSLSAAWYQREIAIPDSWAGRRIALRAECLNSLATVFVDGKAAGEIRFPGGELDLGKVCQPGGKHVLSMLVVAAPLKAVMMSYIDSASARQVRGSVPRRGLCGDVFLLADPAGARIDGVQVDPSVRLKQITCTADLRRLAAAGQYQLRARITRMSGDTTEIASKVFSGSDLKNGRISFSGSHKPPRLWDLHTPGNRETLQLALLDGQGRVLDTFFDQRFGFREFWIDGRDFYLNGTRIYLSAVPLDNAALGAGMASYECRVRAWGGSRALASTLFTRTITAASRGPI